MLRTRYLVTAIAAAMLLAANAQAATDQPPVDNVVVFGDSLSDAGQFFSTSLNTYSKFTTNPGDVAVQYVAAGYGFNLQPSRVGGSDYAYGGAGVVTDDDGPDPAIPTLTQQVDGYLSNGAKADPRSLYVVWGGANDIFYHSTQYGLNTFFGGGFETAAQATANINAAATQELALISQLKQAGANYVVVFNLPDIGKTPSAAADAALVPGIQTFLSNVSVSYNQTLNAGLAATGANILSVNTYALFNEVLANPAAFGFVNTTVPACTTSSSHDCNANTLVTPTAAQNYLFADGVHPTTAAHEIFGQLVLSELRAPGQISLLGEAPLEVSTAQTKAVRTQMQSDDTGADSRVFATVNFGQQRFDGTYNSPRTTSDDTNVTLGADVRSNDNLSMGVALGLSRNTANFNGGGRYDLNDTSALAYATYHVGGGYLGGYGEAGHSNFTDVNRLIELGPLLRTESGSPNGSHLGAGVTGGWWFGEGTLKNGPFANLEYQSIRVDGYHEAGDDSTAMWFGSQHRKALISTLGWRVQGQWQTANTTFIPYAEVAYNRDSKADPRDVTTGLNSLNGQFSIAGYIPDKTWGSADLGLTAQFSAQLSGTASYNAHFSDSAQKYNAFNLGLRYRF
jgi:outer membrane lipase/esterase